MKIQTYVLLSLVFSIFLFIATLIFTVGASVYATTCDSPVENIECWDGTCVSNATQCPAQATNTPIPPQATATPQPQCSASCRRTENNYGTCGAGSCNSTDRRTGIVYDYKQTWDGSCTDIKCPNAVADVCTFDASCTSGGNPPATPTSGTSPTATPIPPTPTPTTVLMPPALLTEPPVCSDNGWTATFRWTKSPSAVATDYVFRSEYPDIPTPLWLVFDSTDIWKSTKLIQYPYTGSQTDFVASRNVYPNNYYQNWSIETIKGDNYTANEAHRLTSTQGYICKPIRLANPTNCTTACEPSIEVWLNEYTYKHTYKSQDLNNDGIIDLIDFEKIRELKYMPTNTPTPIPPTQTPTPTPTPLPQVQISVKNQQGQPVAVSMYRLQCITDSGQCSSDFLQSQGINSCRHDSRNMSTSTLTVDIQSNTCKAGAGVQYNPAQYTIVGVTPAPAAIQDSYSSAVSTEQNIVWDKTSWNTGKRTINIIVAPVTP